MRPRVWVSRAPNGSSKGAGSWDRWRGRASAVRCRIPPDSSQVRRVRWKKVVMSVRNWVAWSPVLPRVAPRTPKPALSA
jgi:hypothetical protein